MNIKTVVIALVIFSLSFLIAEKRATPFFNFYDEAYNASKSTYVMRSIYEADVDDDDLEDEEIDADLITVGTPVKVTGYPRTLWNQGDIDYYINTIKTNDFAKDTYFRLKGAADKLLSYDFYVPSVEENDDSKKVGHDDNIDKVNTLTIAYFLGEKENPAYAKKAIEVLLKYAAVYEGYGPTKNPNMHHDYSKMLYQRLSEADWGIRAAFAYDLLKSDSSVLSQEDATTIELHLLRPLAYEIGRAKSIFNMRKNWSGYACSCVFMIGRILDDNTLIGWGRKGYGVNTHVGDIRYAYGLIEKIKLGIDAQGFWVEPSPHYMRMATGALTVGCETAWNNGENWYAIGGGSLRKLQETAIIRSTPGAFLPAIEDSVRVDIKENMYTPLIEVIGRRYKDRTQINKILAKRKTFTLETKLQKIFPSRDFNIYTAGASKPLESALISGLGYAIARQTDGLDKRFLMFDVSSESTAEASHGHPDKLQILYYAHDKLIMPDQGIVYYDQPIYKQWYRRTGVHNTVSIGNENMKKLVPHLEIFASRDKMHLMQGVADKAYPDTILTRSVLAMGTMLIDVYRVNTKSKKNIDYSLHFREGDIESYPDGEKGDYFNDFPFKILKNQVKHNAGLNSQFTWDYGDNRKVHLIMETTNTEVYTGTGIVPMDDPDEYVVSRRFGSTHFFSVVDACKGDSKVKELKTLTAESGDYFAGNVIYKDGSIGYIFINYANDPYRVFNYKDISFSGSYGYFELDSSDKLVKAVYCGEGGEVKIGKKVYMKVSHPSTLLIDKYKDNFYTIWNTDNRTYPNIKVTINLPIKKGYKIYYTDNEGKRKSSRKPQYNKEHDAWTFKVPDFNRTELTESSESVYMEKKKKQDATAAAERLNLMKKLKVKIDEIEQQYQKAKVGGADDQIIVIHGENFVSEKNGTVVLKEGRPGSTKKNPNDQFSFFLGWDNVGHEITWEANVIKSGYYQIAVKYCSEIEPVRRLEILSPGQKPFVTQITYNSTGGWSRNSDQWHIASLKDNDLNTVIPIYLEKGKNIIKMTSVAPGGMNIDYIALLDYRLKATRGVIENSKIEYLNFPDFKKIRIKYLGK